MIVWISIFFAALFAGFMLIGLSAMARYDYKRGDGDPWVGIGGIGLLFTFVFGFGVLGCGLEVQSRDAELLNPTAVLKGENEVCVLFNQTPYLFQDALSVNKLTKNTDFSCKIIRTARYNSYKGELPSRYKAEIHTEAEWKEIESKLGVDKK